MRPCRTTRGREDANCRPAPVLPRPARNATRNTTSPSAHRETRRHLRRCRDTQPPLLACRLLAQQREHDPVMPVLPVASLRQDERGVGLEHRRDGSGDGPANRCAVDDPRYFGIRPDPPRSAVPCPPDHAISLGAQATGLLEHRLPAYVRVFTRRRVARRRRQPARPVEPPRAHRTGQPARGRADDRRFVPGRCSCARAVTADPAPQRTAQRYLSVVSLQQCPPAGRSTLWPPATAGLWMSVQHPMAGGPGVSPARLRSPARPDSAARSGREPCRECA